MAETSTCPCKSGQYYKTCCQPFHLGKQPDTAIQLMRSRYAAYALGLADYIIETTHPASPQFHPDKAEWVQQISSFSANTQFRDLEILHSQENPPFATVTFVAHLTQNKKDLSFTEKSYFQKNKGRWLYRSGQLREGRAPNLVTTGPLRLLPLAYYDEPVLRKVGDPITEITDDVRKLVEEMTETMDAYEGLGIAAPQVHHSIQLFMIRKPIENERGQLQGLGEIKVFINPKLSLPSTETSKIPEGCLSIPSIRAEVERPKEITVEYTDLSGKRIQERVTGWEARVIQHENDHVNGVLFIDCLDKEEREQLEPFLRSLKNRILTLSS